MIIIISILWYLIGSIGVLCISRKIYPVTTIKDLLFCFTVAGLGGIVGVLIGLAFITPSDWMNKKVF
jgi:hypothetical protein